MDIWPYQRYSNEHRSTRVITRAWLPALAAAALVVASAQFSQNASAQTLLSCGSDPVQNTKDLQKAIDEAPSGTTLVLPSGTCVVAKCEVARGGAICYGPAGRHNSALNIGRKQGLTLAGAADGTSVLKLDPDPPYNGTRHAYCGDTHVVSTHLSKSLTFRDFTIHGSDGELPEDINQCPTATGTRRIAEHMHDLQLLNSTDVTITRMKILNAHGDGVNLIAERQFTEMPRTERINITQTQFLANDRSGITFQRNVGFVNVVSNYFRNSGSDQDIDMEGTGGKANLGPYNVVIDNNVIERVKPGIAVSIGTANTMWAKDVRLTRNRIGPAPDLAPQPNGGGGCIFINGAEDTVVSANRIIADTKCEAISAQKFKGLVIDNNTLTGYAQSQDASGNLVPRAVIEIHEDISKTEDADDCGGPPLEPCPYIIHYPESVTITRNTLTQQVKFSPVIQLRNADSAIVTANFIRASGALEPTGAVLPTTRSAGVRVQFGIADLPSYGYFVNKKAQLAGWTWSVNHFSGFQDGVQVRRQAMDTSVAAVTLTGNTFSSKRPSPRGIVLENANESDAALVSSLTVSDNFFGCGLTSGGALLPEAFLKPLLQTYIGNTGSVISCL